MAQNIDHAGRDRPELTEEMIEAGVRALTSAGESASDSWIVEEVYKAMVLAASTNAEQLNCASSLEKKS
jgi:hypothetical protein